MPRSDRHFVRRGSGGRKPRKPGLRESGLDDTDRNYAIAMHLSPLAAGIFPLLIMTPLVLWLIRREGSAFADDHGREVVNLLITALILSVVLGIGGLVTFGLGWLAFTAWTVIEIIALIRGAVAASNAEYFGIR